METCRNWRHVVVMAAGTVLKQGNPIDIQSDEDVLAAYLGKAKYELHPQIKNVVTGYGNGPDILKGVDLKLNVGEIKCIIGPNGASKSTVLNAITGILNSVPAILFLMEIILKV